MDGSSPEGNPLAFDVALARFVEYLRVRNVTPETIDNFSRSLRAFYRYLGARGCGSLAEVTRELVLEYPAHLLSALSAHGKPLSVATQANRIICVRLLYRFLVRREWVLVDLAEDLELPRQTSKLPRPLSRRDRERIFAIPDLGTLLGYRNRTMLEVLYGAGLRVKELVSLRLEDLRLAEGLVNVRQGKGRKDRVVPIGRVAVGYLTEYLSRVRPALAGGSRNGDRRRSTRTMPASAAEARVFLTRVGWPMLPHDFRRVLLALAERAGLRDRITPHTLRHTFATDMLRGGGDLRHIQAMLGHASLRATQRYAQIVRRDLKRAHERSHPREQEPPTAPPAAPGSRSEAEGGDQA